VWRQVLFGVSFSVRAATPPRDERADSVRPMLAEPIPTAWDIGSPESQVLPRRNLFRW